MGEILYDHILALVGFTHPLHPVIITMLIGPVMAAVFFQVLGLLFKVPSFFSTSRQMTVMGFIFWFPTVIIGVTDWYYFYGGSPEMVTILYKSIGAGLLFITLLSTILCFKKIPKSSVFMLVFYIASAGLVSGIGALGGDIVFSKEPKTASGVENTQAAPDGTKTLTHEDFTLSWKIEGPNVTFRLSNPTEGWVGLGFGNTGLMKGSHIVLGYVDEKGNGVVEDHFGNANSKHTSKDILGRPDTLLDKGASFNQGVTTIWFTLPLQSTDPGDPVLVPGEILSVIVARATKAKDLKTYHGNAETGGRYSFKIQL